MTYSTKRLLKNIILLFAGNFVVKVLSFLMVPFYTAYLTTSEYGVSDLISTTVLLALPFFSLLMDEAIMRFALDNAKDKKQVFTIATTISTAGFMAVLCVSPIILLFDSLRDFYWLVLLYYISLWCFNICSNFVKGLDKIAVVTIAGVIHTLAYVGLNILFLAFFKIGIIGYLLAIDISNIIAAIYLIIYCRLYKYLINFKKIDWKLTKEMLKYSIPMIPDYISWWVINCSDRYMITGLVGTSATGLYTAAYKLPSVLVSANSIFMSAWRISSVEDFGSATSISFFNRIYKNYNAFLFSSSAILILLTKPLSSLLLSGEFFHAWTLTPFLVFAYILSMQAIFIGSIFTASKRTGRLFVAPLVGSIFNILFNFVLIPELGAMGAAIATCIGYMIVLIINMYNTRKILRMDFQLLTNLYISICILIECILIIQDEMVFNIMATFLAIIIIAFHTKILYPLLSTTILKIIKR